MTALAKPANPEWVDVTLYEVTERILGGETGPLNRAPRELMERTEWLRQKVEAAQGGVESHQNSEDPHPQYAKDADLAAHVNAEDPHPGYTTGKEVSDIVSNFTSQAGFTKKELPNVWQRGQSGAVAALPATTGPVTLDMSQSNNFEGVLTGNIVLANPSVMPVGQSGVIRIIQGATPVTIAYGSVWKGASGVLPGLTAVAGAVDDLVYYVESASRILITSIGDTK